MKRFVFLTLVAGCNWMTFDDLATSSPVHAQEKPSDNKATDYGIVIVNGTGTDPGGVVAVLSNGPPSYSTLDFDEAGETSQKFTESLGQQTINAFGSHPIMIGDNAGNVAVVEKSVDGPIVVARGVVSQLSGIPLTSQQAPDAATFAGARVIVAAVAAAGAAAGAASANLFVVTTTDAPCVVVDDMAMPLSTAALASDGTTLFAWTKTGVLLAYSIAALDTGCAATIATTPSAPIGPIQTIATTVTSPMANGGHIDLIGSPATHALLTVYDSNQTSSAQIGNVTMVRLGATPAAAAPLALGGVRSVTAGTLGNSLVLVAGFPQRTVGTTVTAGEVEVHTIDTTANALDTTAGMLGQPAQRLSIPQADTNLTFGRSVAIMKFSVAGTAKSVLVVAASNIIYAYYKTKLYDDVR